MRENSICLYGIYLADSQTCKVVWLWSYFAEKLLIVNPYFQYFSSSLLYKYQLDLPEHLEHAWLITLKKKLDLRGASRPLSILIRRRPSNAGLISATTHCGLIKLQQHRRISTMNLVTKSIHDPYSDCKNVNSKLL